jgi:transposase
LTISELLERLLAERGIKASRAALWTFLDRCGPTLKKRPPTRASMTGQTS